MPAVPENGPLLELFVGQLYPAPSGQPGDYLEVASLVGRREGHPQPEAGGQGELLLHGIAGVDVVCLVPLGETFPDEVATIRGSVDADVLRRLLDATLQQRLERFVLHLVFLEREVIHEEDEARPAAVQLLQYLRQRPEVLLRHLDEPQPPVCVLVQDGLYGGGLAGAGHAVEEGMVGRESREETLGVPEQRLALALVPDELGEADRVGVPHGPQPSSAPADRPVTPEGARTVPGEVVCQQPRAIPPVAGRRELPGDHAAGRLRSGPPRVLPRDPGAPEPGYGLLDPAEQGLGLELEELSERPQVAAGLLHERAA